jgi:hypothetical protein
VPYPYLGIAPRMYPQYTDLDADGPLQPEPGGSYSMAPAAGHEGMAVPPQDGLWGAETEAAPEAAPEPPAEAAPAKTTKKAAAAAEQGA